jgi:hypothetical protein
MELTERKWGAKLADMRKQQKRAYGRCIVRWATEGLPNKVAADVLQEFKAAKKKGTQSITPACVRDSCAHQSESLAGGGSLTASPLARKKADMQQEQRGSPGGREDSKGKSRWWNKKKGGDANEGYASGCANTVRSALAETYLLTARSDSPQPRSAGSVNQQQQQPQPQYQPPVLASTPSGEAKWEHFTVLLGRSKALHHFGLGAGDVTQFCRLRASSDGT